MPAAANFWGGNTCSGPDPQDSGRVRTDLTAMLSAMFVAPTLLSWAMSPVTSAGCGRLAVGLRRGCHPIACTPPPMQLLLPLGALSAGLTAAIESAAEQDMQDLAASDKAVDLRALELDEEELEGHKVRLLDELGDIEAAGLIFQAGATSTLLTLTLIPTLLTSALTLTRTGTLTARL